MSHYSFCTNGSYNAGEAGIPTIGFGHSLGDEYIEIDQLVAACRGMQGYAGIAESILSEGGDK